jgi:hypothetical protein
VNSEDENRIRGMTKRKRQKTIQWPKVKDRRQYNDQKKKTEDNTMTKRYQRGNQKPYIEDEQTTQWPKDTK